MSLAQAAGRATANPERWNDTIAAVAVQAPQALTGDWLRADNEDVIWRLVLDVVRVAQPNSRRGQRPMPTPGEVKAAFRGIQGLEYTTEAFAAAFATLTGSRSFSQLAHRTGLDRTKLWRLKRGQDEPTPAEMEAIAAAFGKDARYFHEYRCHLVCAAVAQALRSDPDRSAAVASRIDHR